MKSAFAYLCLSLVLLQTFSRELLVVDFALNRTTITARFCVNKARPALHCDGQCYFAKQLKKQQQRESQAPNPLKERLEMLPAALGWLVPARPAAYPASASCFPRVPGPAVSWGRERAVFQPPQT